MLYVSIFTSDRSRDPELWAAIWHGAGPPSIKLHGAYNLGTISAFLSGRGNRWLTCSSWTGSTTSV